MTLNQMVERCYCPIIVRISNDGERYFLVDTQIPKNSLMQRSFGSYDRDTCMRLYKQALKAWLSTS